MIFHQFRAADGQLSYLFADPVTRRAAVIDPHLGLEQGYFEMLRHFDLKLEFAIETHAHESHLSAAPLLCEEAGGRWVLPEALKQVAAAFRIADDALLYLGEECVGALATPGHSACSMCYRWRETVFTGHTLLAGETGHCGRPDADPKALYESIRQRLFTLPPTTRIWPGCEVEDRRQSTVGFERRNNCECNETTTSVEFVAAKRSNRLLPRQVMPLSTGRDGADLYPYRRGAPA